MAFIVEVVSLEGRAGYFLEDVQQISMRAVEASGGFAADIVRCMPSEDVAIEFAVESVPSRLFDCGVVLHVRVPCTLQKGKLSERVGGSRFSGSLGD